MSNPAFRRRVAVVLASLIATLCVTIVAPVVDPEGCMRIFSTHEKMLLAGHDMTSGDMGSHATHDDHGAHCPLCMPAGTPSSYFAWDFTPVQPLAHVRESIPAARHASLVGAPLPARGPPLVS